MDYLGVSAQEALYREATQTYRAALQRLARAYENDPDKRRDLLQDIHLALWLSFEKYEARCSLRTWVYRVAHNTATSYVIRQHRGNSGLQLTLEDLETMPEPADAVRAADARIVLERIMDIIQTRKAPERARVLLYVE